MVKPSPILDPRTAEDIETQVHQLLGKYLPEDYPKQSQANSSIEEVRPLTGMEAALVKVFARFSEIILERFNQVPEKNLLAFLNLLGATRHPPQPARVPLTFFLAKGTTKPAKVPSSTQVAAPPASGEKDPIVFETEQELVVTPARLVALKSRDPARDRWQDLDSLLDSAASEIQALPAFRADASPSIEHSFYIRQDDILAHPNLAGFRLNLSAAKDSATTNGSVDLLDIEWTIVDTPLDLSHQGLSETAPFTTLESPTQTRADNESVEFEFGTLKLPVLEKGQPKLNRWLRGRLPSALAPGTVLPRISRATLTPKIEIRSAPIVAAFLNQSPLEVTQPFYPFGEKPKFGNTCYLGFAIQDTWLAQGKITLTVETIDPNESGADSNPSQVDLTWEMWDVKNSSWENLGTTSSIKNGSDENGSENSAEFDDAIPESPESPEFHEPEFVLPKSLAKHNHRGIEAAWLRVQITKGNYTHEEAKYTQLERDGKPVLDDNGKPIYVLSLPPFAPPMLRKVSVSYSLDYDPSDSIDPAEIFSHNDFVIQPHAPKAEFQPFSVSSDASPAPAPTLYLGLQATRESLANNSLTLFFELVAPRFGEQMPDNASPQESPQLSWQYWNGTTWQKFAVVDGTESLRRSGVVSGLLPADIHPSQEFGLEAIWLRVRWSSGDYKFEPRLRHVWLNTTWASQTISHQQEVLGSSNGEEDQRFQSRHYPILARQVLAVREPEAPSGLEQQMLKQTFGEDAILREETGGTWVVWQEVPDFYGSAPDDRHYTLNSLTGAIQFGNGRNGRIPPQGRGNIQLRWYRSGGGPSGNVAAETITQLKTTVPYVNKAINPLPATGGAQAEPLSQMKERLPRQARHRGRAVTLEDYEDLAKLASPAVARAKCLPATDLTLPKNATAAETPDETEVEASPGAVSVIIVPHFADAAPQPTEALIQRVSHYLRDRASPTVDIRVVGPGYFPVSITATIGVRALEGVDRVQQAVQATLDRFLHPLTGGLDGKGWGFGRSPYRSDFFALLEKVPGVEYVRSLTLPELTLGPNELVASGTHTIALHFDPDL